MQYGWKEQQGKGTTTLSTLLPFPVAAAGRAGKSDGWQVGVA
jgi:hypothetical protein